MNTTSLLALNKKAFWYAFFWTLMIIYLCLKTPTGEQNIHFPNADKIVHFIFHFGFIFFWHGYLFSIKRTRVNDKIILVIVSIFFGILIELGQKYLTTTRQADVWDVIANTVGSLVGVFVVINVFSKKIFIKLNK